MLIHIVCWKYKPETDKYARENHRDRLKALVGVIPEIVSFDIGADMLHLDRSFDYVVDFLVRGEESAPRRFDPSGEEALRDAKRLRKAALAVGGERSARKEAAERFGLKAESLGWTAKLPAPLHVIKDLAGRDG